MAGVADRVLLPEQGAAVVGGVEAGVAAARRLAVAAEDDLLAPETRRARGQRQPNHERWAQPAASTVGWARSGGRRPRRRVRRSP